MVQLEGITQSVRRSMLSTLIDDCGEVRKLEADMRIKSLDSMRGMAALIVLLHHCAWTYPERIVWIKDTPFRLFFAGGSAVLVFFALSGFVLHLTFTNNDGRQAFPYLVKRIARIYPAFAIAVALSWVLYEAVDHVPISSLSTWFNRDNWGVPVDGTLVMGHLAMTDRPDWQSLNNVVWSLVVETRISLIFPFLAAAVVRNWFLALIVSLILAVVSGWLVDAHPTGSTLDPFSTVRYLHLFVAGAVLAQHREAIFTKVASLSRSHRVALWILALAMFAVPSNAGQGLPAGFGSLLLMALSFSDRQATTILTGRIQLWLGKISYSLYLVHLPILLATVHLLHSQLPMICIFLIAALVSMATAEVMHRMIEAPCIEIGRQLANRLRSGQDLEPVSSSIRRLRDRSSLALGARPHPAPSNDEVFIPMLNTDGHDQAQPVGLSPSDRHAPRAPMPPERPIALDRRCPAREPL